MKWFIIKSIAFSIDREDKIDKDSIFLNLLNGTPDRLLVEESDKSTPTAASKRVSMVSV